MTHACAPAPSRSSSTYSTSEGVDGALESVTKRALSQNSNLTAWAWSLILLSEPHNIYYINYITVI